MEKIKEPVIKIYVSCHKESYIPDNELLYPIQVGTAIAEKRLPDMLHDDEGDNISDKNKQYCELTAQYWAWKNDTSADYYGFMHYRRYFNFGLKQLDEDGWGNIEYKKALSVINLEEIGLEEDVMTKVISQYDVIVPCKRDVLTAKSIYEQYCISEGQHEKDLKKVLDILLQKYPDYYKTAREYLNANEAYECNMFIMKKRLFQQYSEWLFNILFELEKQSDMTEYSEIELRMPAYLGERLFGIWFYHNKDKIKSLELQKTLFRDTNPETKVNITDTDAVVIVMSCDNRFVPFLSVTLESIMQNASSDRRYEICILTSDIEEKNKKCLLKEINKKENFKLSFLDVSNYIKKEDFWVDQHVSVETYFRLLIPEIFVQVNKVLYIDVDLVVNHDLAELYDIDIEDYCIAAVRDIDIEGNLKLDKNLFKYIKEEIGCKEEKQYFQAGVLLLNLELIRNLYTTEQLLKIALQRSWHYWDQDVMNYAFKGRIYYLPQNWNVIINWKNEMNSRMNAMKMAPYSLFDEYRKARKNPFIIHYAGYQKPWNEQECDMAEYFWKYARNTPYYEIILSRMQKTNENVVYQNPVNVVDNSLVQQVDNQGIKVRGIDDTIYVDGIMIKAINKFNKKYPIGSKKRDRLRRFVKKFVK